MNWIKKQLKRKLRDWLWKDSVIVVETSFMFPESDSMLFNHEERVKVEMATKICNKLLADNLIEYIYYDDPESMKTIVRARLRLFKKPLV